MEKFSENQASAQVSNNKFQPNFGAALAREKSTVGDNSIQVGDINPSIQDSFGSWREWD